MNLILDVHYFNQRAQSAGILFEWCDDKPIKEFVVVVEKVDEYESGSFYKRELPCLLALLKEVPITEVNYIIIDGFVFLDNENKPGLGKYLYDAIDKISPVIGIAKNGFIGNTTNVREVRRGISRKPIYVSSVGVDPDYAAERVLDMHGSNRLPTMVTCVDHLSRKHL